jgi:hypothetical protein
MNAQQIIDLIQERINGTEYGERVATEAFLTASTDEQRAGAVTMSQISVGQRNVLQGILDEINEASEA